MTEAHPTGRCSRCHQRVPAGEAPGSAAGYRPTPSRERGRPPAPGGAGLWRYDRVSPYGGPGFPTAPAPAWHRVSTGAAVPSMVMNRVH